MKRLVEFFIVLYPTYMQIDTTHIYGLHLVWTLVNALRPVYTGPYMDHKE